LKYYCEYYTFGGIQVVSKKILVVDDESIIRELLENFLGKAGYLVYTATTGEEALEILSQESVTVIFIDLGLEVGEMNGFELCEKIRKKNPSAIIYALTGYAKLFDSKEFRQAGFDDWFAKPPNVEAIQQALKDAFAKIGGYNAIERILIIDDDDQFRKLLRQMLEREGYSVLEAPDGEEGIRCQSEQPADLIIVDVIMPGKDGIDTMLEIKDEFTGAKFIVTTGNIGYWPDAKINIAQTLGARTLRKPFKRKELLEVIEQL
jgi:CheY-like chemotaxis protein